MNFKLGHYPSPRHRRFCAPYARIDRTQMTFSAKARALFTDSHLLVPLIVFSIGLALLITLH